ncbi:MAG: BadF/BadG/BcrA/BcrD ATPase family protein [Acidobacteriaceae bacterium]|jgi:N-acetylglucosamine kinase-like BadF-type ATPase
MSLFLAIDAGGTKTQCLLADETRVLARDTAGTVKLMRVGEPEATARLQAMLAEVAGAAGVPLNHIARTCFGLAGIGSPAVRAWASRVLSSSVSGELLICGDEEIALDAAFAEGPGILVVAGTGSNAIGRTDAGETFGAGGWGPVLGDEGSGNWIGLEAIRAALRAQDRIPLGDQLNDQLGDSTREESEMKCVRASTSLLREIEQHWKLNSLGELVAYGNQRGDCGRPAPEFASLAPIVARCAEQGDALAAEVLTRAGVELAELVALVFRKMAASQPGAKEADAIEVAYTGGVLAHIAPVRAAMTARLAVLLPAACVRQSAVDPLEGALWRARKG